MIYQNAIYKEKTSTQNKKIYKVGDIYNENGKEGLVFWVDETGEHGKIVSLDELEEVPFPHFGIFNGINIHSISRFDGQSNTDILNQLKISKDVKPFVWCRDKGLDWYIPAIEELRMLLSCQKCFSQNNKLQKMGKPTIKKRGIWMSSTVIKTGLLGKCLHCIDHHLLNVNFSNHIRVRAISKF